MELTKDKNERLNSIKSCGEFKFEDIKDKVESGDGENISILYVDYDLIRVDESDSNKLWGNWSLLTSKACDDPEVRSYVDRRNMRDYGFVLRCNHHSESDEGVYKFSIAVGGV
mgnify:CR=1 FL=1|jgi:hypothetical protein